MIFCIEKDYHHFCCSTLPLLNGDIKRLIDNYRSEGFRNIRELYGLICNFIYRELSSSDYKKFKARKIRREYLRMYNLYKFRLEGIK